MTSETSTHKPHSKPSMGAALIPVVFLVLALAAAVYLYGGDAISGPVQLAMFLAMILATLVGLKNGHTIPTMTAAAIDSVASAMGAIFILLSVGALIGSWNMSGTIATMTEWGIRFLNPDFFYVTAAVICALVALGIGSSWTVIGTIGVALVAIGEGLGVSVAMTAGAVISGAYFGDKMSPLSETTNLAPAVAGTDLYSHIKAMMATTMPSFLIALGLYTYSGLQVNPEGALELDAALVAINQSFFIGLIPMIPLVVVIIMAVRKAPPTFAITAGALTASVVSVIWQKEQVLAFVDDSSLSTPWALLKGAWDAMATGFVADTGFVRLDALLSGGGMSSILGTVWLIMVALAFGGVMNECGFLARLIEPLRRRAKSDRGILAATGTTAIGINVITADQYLAIVLTGNVYKTEFAERGIAPQTLSRQIEDTATVTSPLIPWNSCGAYAAGVLGVSTVAYFPFAFFNLINPILSFMYALLGLQIKRVPATSQVPESPHDTEFYGVAGRRGDEVPLED